MMVTAGEWTSPGRLETPVNSVDAAHALIVTFQGPPALVIAKLGIDSVRIFLGADANIAHTLYELLCANSVQILVRDPTPSSRVRPLLLRPENLRPAGFEEEEAMLPYPRRSFPGYRLLQEYFTFPEKYFFIDVEGLQEA